MSTGINTQNTYELQELVNPTDKSIRKVTTSVDGSSRVDSEGDTSLFKESNEMGKDAFLNLLVTQLRYQDPLNPTADTQFVAQLAQFSSLETSQSMEKSISGLSENMNEFMTLQTLNSQSTVNAQSVGLLGKTVRVSNPEITYAGSPVTVNVQANDGRSVVYAAVKNAEGKTVSFDKIQLENSNDTTYTWDGLTDENAMASNGKYTIEILDDYQAKTVGSVYVEGNVDAIRYTENGANVQIDGKNYLPRYIMNIVEG